MRSLLRLAAFACAGAIAATACSAAGGERIQASGRTPGATASATASTSPPASPSPAPVDPASVHANELGKVPVIMYHMLLPDPEGPYDITPAAFRAELERLARDGFVPVTARDFATGNIDIPAGKHPVVLTFDDSTTSQLSLTENGKPEPKTAVAILRDVAKDHPGFTPTATFFVSRAPFAEPGGQRVLTWLHEHGFEIGNHTYDHVNLGPLSPAEVREEIGKEVRAIRQVLPGYDVASLSLPMGVHPDRERLALRGSWEGLTYEFTGVYLVGARPAPSPYDTDFDPLNIPRIRTGPATGPGGDYQSGHYLNEFEKDPSGWYTSDGNPKTISFPKEAAGELDGKYAGRANPY